MKMVALEVEARRLGALLATKLGYNCNIDNLQWSGEMSKGRLRIPGVITKADGSGGAGSFADVWKEYRAKNNGWGRLKDGDKWRLNMSGSDNDPVGTVKDYIILLKIAIGESNMSPENKATLQGLIEQATSKDTASAFMAGFDAWYTASFDVAELTKEG